MRRLNVPDQNVQVGKRYFTVVIAITAGQGKYRSKSVNAAIAVAWMGDRDGCELKITKGRFLNDVVDFVSCQVWLVSQNKAGNA